MYVAQPINLGADLVAFLFGQRLVGLGGFGCMGLNNVCCLSFNQDEARQ